MLNIARNTVMLAYQSLVDEGFLEARERSGYYVADDIMAGRAATPTASKRTAGADGVDWSARFPQRPSEPRNIIKPKEIGRETWREKGCPHVSILVGAGTLKKKKIQVSTVRNNTD